MAEGSAFVGGRAASLQSKEVAKRAAADIYQCGLDSRYVQLYRETYIKFDPTTGYGALGSKANSKFQQRGTARA
jgi:hypothetical protein